MIVIPLRRFTVVGNSMLPMLRSGQDVLVWCWTLRFRVRDVVAVKSSKIKMPKEIIKRIKKISGDQVWIEGDNLDESTDSRQFGWVSKRDIIGKVIYQT